MNIFDCLQQLQDDEIATIYYDWGQYGTEQCVRKYKDDFYKCEWDGYPIEKFTLQSFERITECVVKKMPKYTSIGIGDAVEWFNNGGTIAIEIPTGSYECEYQDLNTGSMIDVSCLNQGWAIKNW